MTDPLLLNLTRQVYRNEHPRPPSADLHELLQRRKGQSCSSSTRLLDVSVGASNVGRINGANMVPYGANVHVFYLGICFKMFMDISLCLTLEDIRTLGLNLIKTTTFCRLVV